MMVFSVTAIFLLDGTRVRSLAVLGYFLTMNWPVASVSKTPMAARSVSL